jgi:HemY protein
MAIAASAAHQLRDPTLRDELLSKLKTVEAEVLRQDPLIAPLLEAQFAVDERKGAKALAALVPLTRGDRRHVHTLRLALKANQLQENWEEVLRISKLLENRKAINLVEAARYKEQVARAWIKADRHKDARRMLESAIDQHWDTGLCMLYAQCDDSPKEQLSKLEEWLQRYPLDPQLNWALGRLCQRQQLWGKARMHLEASLRQKPMVQTHLALAEIAESLGEKETAAIHWKAAAKL